LIKDDHRITRRYMYQLVEMVL